MGDPDKEVRWVRVGDVNVAYVKASLKSGSRKDPIGYRELNWNEVPAAVREVADQYEWYHFGLMGSIVISGPTKSSRIKAARAVGDNAPSSIPTHAEPSIVVEELVTPTTMGNSVGLCEAPGSDGSCLGVRGDSMLMLRNPGKSGKYRDIKAALEQRMPGFRFDVSCLPGQTVAELAKSISSGPYFKTLFLAFGCNGLDPSAKQPTYLQQLDENLTELQLAASQHADDVIIMCGAPASFWKYPPVWNDWMLQAHRTLNRACPLNVQILPIEAGASMGTGTMHRDTLHIENNDDNMSAIASFLSTHFKRKIERARSRSPRRENVSLSRRILPIRYERKHVVDD